MKLYEIVAGISGLGAIVFAGNDAIADSGKADKKAKRQTAEQRFNNAFSEMDATLEGKGKSLDDELKNMQKECGADKKVPKDVLEAYKRASDDLDKATKECRDLEGVKKDLQKLVTLRTEYKANPTEDKKKEFVGLVNKELVYEGRKATLYGLIRENSRDKNRPSLDDEISSNITAAQERYKAATERFSDAEKRTKKYLAPNEMLIPKANGYVIQMSRVRTDKETDIKGQRTEIRKSYEELMKDFEKRLGDNYSGLLKKTAEQLKGRNPSRFLVSKRMRDIIRSDGDRTTATTYFLNCLYGKTDESAKKSAFHQYLVETSPNRR